jgi:hypothetical protein
MQTSHASLVEQFSVDSHGTLPFQEAYRVRHTVFGRNAEAHVDVIRHAVPVQQLHPSLTTQLPQNHANLFPQIPIEHFSPKPWYDYHMVLSLPPHVGQALPFVHRPLLPAPTGLPGRRAYAEWKPIARRIAPKLFGSHGQRSWF